MRHIISGWGPAGDDTEYRFAFRYLKGRRATLEQPEEPEDVEIEEVWLNDELVEVSEKHKDCFITQAWEFLNDEPDAPDWKREYEVNYER